ncbi:MAG: ATP-binding protein [Acidimicrobiia bacterium]|nr:ATP-binding protein [Acidimicrobiia bacterium]
MSIEERQEAAPRRDGNIPRHLQKRCRFRNCVQLRWTFGGALFGLVFPLVGWLAAGAASSGVSYAHRSQPVLYIVDLAPFVLGLTGYAIGHFHARLIKIRQSIESQVHARTAELQDALDELSSTQAELLNAQKLEALGGLAAGIAHEINTPIQYVGDNTRFVEESLQDLLALAEASSHLADAVRDVSEVAGLIESYNNIARKADVDFLTEEIPGALEESLEGIEQVASIVKALKSFAHPGSDSKTEDDLNEIITTTVAVTRNEWKYVADMNLDGLDPDLPHTPVMAGPLKQVLLNMIVNSAQAIEELNGDGETKGTISIATRQQGDRAVIEISDTGAGIPEPIHDRILEPFFTTKEVGRGSGQGLAIAQSIIVDKHEGSLRFESALGEGTTFFIELPLATEMVPA